MKTLSVDEIAAKLEDKLVRTTYEKDGKHYTAVTLEWKALSDKGYDEAVVDLIWPHMKRCFAGDLAQMLLNIVAMSDEREKEKKRNISNALCTLEIALSNFRKTLYDNLD